MPIFFGVCLLILAGAGTSKAFILRAKGIAAEARIVSMEQVRDYSVVNKFRPDKFAIKLLFNDREGKPQSRDVLLSASEKESFHAEIGALLPLVYVPGSKAYAVSREIPSWTESAIACSLLLPGGFFLIFLGLASFLYKHKL